MILAAATATAPERPHLTECERFRTHMGAAFANMTDSSSGNLPAGLPEAMTAANAAFQRAQQDIVESLHATRD
jgi:hypothetical protein